MLVVFDIDGTLANVEHRMHYIKPDPDRDPETGKRVKRRFDLFHKACVDDTPIEPVVKIYREYVRNPEARVVLLTGRDNSVRRETVDWFSRHGLNGYDLLVMKPEAEKHTPDTDFKRWAADEIEDTFGMPIHVVFEDRDRVIQMWKDRGTHVIDVK